MDKKNTGIMGEGDGKREAPLNLPDGGQVSPPIGGRLFIRTKPHSCIAFFNRKFFNQ